MKIWAKVMRADKQAVSYAADVSTPVILPAHYERFERFNRVKFLPSDFIEEVDFTSFVLERVKEDKPPAHARAAKGIHTARLR